MILAGTGHRPDKLGGYDLESSEKLYQFALKALEKLRPTWVISGMALGWDMALAEAAITLAIPFTAAVPFAGQQSRWPLKAQIQYRFLMLHAAERIIVCEGDYAAWKMQKRNEWMVDNTDAIAALWDGSGGGTANCIAYAEKQKKPIINLWDNWRNELLPLEFGKLPL